MAVSPSDEMAYDGLYGFVIAPVLYKSEKYRGCFLECVGKVPDDIKHFEPSQARKLTRYFVQCAELLKQSDVMGKYGMSMHTLWLVSYADYSGKFRGYQLADGGYVLMKDDEVNA